MKKPLRLLSTLATVLVLSTAIAGCKKSESTSTGTGTPAAQGGKSIVIWTHWYGEAENKAIDKVAQDWAKKTGNTVKLVQDKSQFQEYTTAAQSSKGPDIMLGMPHDNLGVFQKANLLDEVPAGFLNDSDYASKAVLDAVTFGGKKYAVPLGMETYALFYNTELVKEVPKTTEDLVALGKTVGFNYDINNFYFSYGWISGNGGYVFKNNGGTLDPTDLGLGNDGAVKGYQFIQDLVVKEKLMKADIKGDAALGAFTNKKTGLYISGPWDVGALQKAKVPFAVAPLPTINGNPTKSFMGVQTAFVSSKSKNKAEAWDLLKTLIANSFEIVYKGHSELPVLKADLEKDEFKNDKMASAFAEQAKVAEPMPNIAEMGAVWTPAGNNLTLLTQGKQDAATTAKNIEKQIKEGIAQMK